MSGWNWSFFGLLAWIVFMWATGWERDLFTDVLFLQLYVGMVTWRLNRDLRVAIREAAQR